MKKRGRLLYDLRAPQFDPVKLSGLSVNRWLIQNIICHTISCSFLVYFYLFNAKKYLLIYSQNVFTITHTHWDTKIFIPFGKNQVNDEIELGRAQVKWLQCSVCVWLTDWLAGWLAGMDYSQKSGVSCSVVYMGIFIPSASSSVYSSGDV